MLNPQIEELHLVRICDSDVKDFSMMHDLWYSVILRLKTLRVIEVTQPWLLSSKMIDLLGQVEHQSYYFFALSREEVLMQLSGLKSYF